VRQSGSDHDAERRRTTVDLASHPESPATATMSEADKQQTEQETLSFGDEELTFDDALEKLEELAAQLEAGDVPLEKALEVYESAVHLFAFCRSRLDGMEQRIEQLSETLDGTLTVEPTELPAADAEHD
jgi:exodeoxyribonuclease VII small subunit